MSEKSLCFRSAGKALQDYPDAQGSISEEQWMWHIVQHMRGARHKLCTPLDPITNLADPVGHAISKIVLNNDYEPLKEEEAQMYEKLLVDSLHGNLDSVKNSFEKVKQLREPYLNPATPVAVVGAYGGQTDVLKFGLERGAPMDKDLAFSIQRGAEKSEGMKAYYEENKKLVDDKREAKPDPRTKPHLNYGLDIAALDAARGPA